MRQERLSSAQQKPSTRVQPGDDHVIDAERVFAYRAMRIARGDTTPLPGFDEKAWVPQSGAAQRTLADLLTELKAVRTAGLTTDLAVLIDNTLDDLADPSSDSP